MKRLLIRPGAIGDCILWFRAMRAARAEETEVWAPSAILPLIEGVDRVASIASTGLDLVGIPEIKPPAATMRRLAEFDSIYSWYGTKRPEFRAALAGLPVQFFEALPPADSRLHAEDFFLHQVSGGVAGLNPLAAPSRRSIVIHPFSGSPKKNWPLERFRELAARLPLPVEWCAGPKEELLGAHREENLARLGDWIAGASLYIGNDSGISHLAAFRGCRAVVLFGPTDPEIWAPRGPAVRVIRRPELSGLAVEEVLTAVEDALG